MIRFFTPLALILLLSGCGLRPLYSGGTQGIVAQNIGSVEVPAIEGRAGWLVRNALNDRLAPITNGTGPAYRLDIALDDQIEGFGVIANDEITRERRILRARYQLVNIVTGEAVIDATAGSDAGIDVVSSEFATIAAEDRALENLAVEIAEQIIQRMALYARKNAASDVP